MSTPPPAVGGGPDRWADWLMAGMRRLARELLIIARDQQPAMKRPKSGDFHLATNGTTHWP